MPQKQTRQQFAAAIKAKYPVYADLPDEELTQSILAKYPVYQADVETPEEAAALAAGPAPLGGAPAPAAPPAPYNFPHPASVLAHGVTLGAAGEAPTTLKEKILEMAGAAAPVVAGAVAGGPAGAAVAGGVQGAGGSVGRSVNDARASNQPLNLRTTAAKAVGHGAVGAIAGAAPAAVGKSIASKLITGPAIGAPLTAAPNVIEQYLNTGTVDVNNPDLQLLLKLGAGVGLGAGAVSAALPRVAGKPSQSTAGKPIGDQPIPPPPGHAPAGDPLFNRVREATAPPPPAPDYIDAEVVSAQSVPIPRKLPGVVPSGQALPASNLTDLHGILNQLARKQAELYKRSMGLAPGTPEHQVLMDDMASLVKHRDELVAEREGQLAAAGSATTGRAPVDLRAEAAAGGRNVLHTAGWTQTGEQLGSNTGGFYTSPDGVQWYVKQPPGGLIDALRRAQSEVLASQLYRAAGVEVPEVQLAQHGGRPAIASKVIPGLERATPEGLGADPRFGRGAAADTWLANADAAGTEFDNVMMGAQGPVRLDLGGALLYDAAGAPRQLSHVAEEFDAFRAPENPMAALLGRQPKEALEEGAAKLAAVSDDQIHQIIEQSGYGTAVERARLADTLISRRDDIVRRMQANVGQSPGISVWRGVRGEGFDAREPRPGYITAYTTSKDLAQTYAGEAGRVEPFTLRGKRIIEFPVRKSAMSAGNEFDKFAFDRRAQQLADDEVLVARQVYDTGPWASLKLDPERKWSYPSDVYATRSSAFVEAGHQPSPGFGQSIELLDDSGPVLNASGESAASVEALNRQASMASRGEQFAVRKGGVTRPLIGPDAVDYRPRPGETFGVLKDGQFSPLAQGERGAVSPALLSRLGGAAVGGPIGSVLAQDDEGRPSGAGFFLGALGGAVLGKIAYKTALTRGARQRIIQGMHTSPGVTEALKRTAPKFRSDMNANVRTLAEGVSDVFVPYGELKRSFAQAGAPGLERAAVDIFDRIAGRLYELPGEVVQRLHHIVDPLKGNNDDYTQLFQILRLRRDIEERLLDTTRRTQAFNLLAQYRAAKRAGDQAQITTLRRKLLHNRRYMKPVPANIRATMDMGNAQATLANLMNDAAANRPQILEAANRYKQTMTQVGQELEAEGLLSPQVLAENQEYFPDYVLTYLTDRLSVGGTRGLHASRKSGFTKPRGVRSPEHEVWNDLLGPVAKRLLDQQVVLERGRAANQILDAYDPIRQGRVQPNPEGVTHARYVTEEANDGLTYAAWVFRDPTNPRSPSAEGFVPMQLHDELVRRYVADNDLTRLLKKANSNIKGFLVRGGFGGFLAQNLAGDMQSLYAGTPWTQWHTLPAAQVRGLVASTLEALYKDPAAVQGWKQAPRQLAERGAKAGIGTAAAAAEVTEAVVSEPIFRELAAPPTNNPLHKALDAAVDEFAGGKRVFDTTRQVIENTNRLAGFIERTNRGVPEPEAGKIVKHLIGNYDPNFFTLAESSVGLRGFMVPFYAFYKNNFRNWIPGLAKEVAGPSGMTAARGAGARTVVAKWAKIAPISLAAIAWNHYMFPEAEATLSPWQKDQFHVIVPDPFDPWNEETGEWNLDYIGFPTPANMAARAVGLGGLPNRLVHAAQGTGEQDFDEGLKHSMQQAADFWTSLVNPALSATATLVTGKDTLSGQKITQPGQSVPEKIAEHVSHFVGSMPVGRQLWRAGREGTSPDEDLWAFARRMAIGGLWQDIDVDANMAKAVRRSVAEGRRKGQESQKERTAQRISGKIGPTDFTPEELLGMIGSDDPRGPRAQWQTLAADLLKLAERASADLPPDAPGATDRATGPQFSFTPSRRGPAAIPTVARLSSQGPDAALKEFFATLGASSAPGFNVDRYRSAMADIADQLKEQDAQWDIPAAIMRVLIQEPSGEEDVEILKRLQGLAGAKSR